MEKFKDRLQEALNVRGMLPVELAQRSGINKGTISRYLKGVVIPKQSAIGAMAKALSVSPAWLMGYELNMDGTEAKETLPSGTYRGGVDITAKNNKISPVLEKLSPNNQEKLLDYALFLLQQQDKGDES